MSPNAQTDAVWGSRPVLGPYLLSNPRQVGGIW